ncbi:MAG TPA: response regulator transcription factor [Oligoflexus sp.]|uniref:response regulator transcription factor n=1 Tax=Oligoflexus sp. TaxID=1971216 RepID=UPI002D3D6835|nr:response regulator transcription factor [Oligoflexus sp.]HYX31567.1 response regulator transcription factor [Oligoflexus sp.]
MNRVLLVEDDKRLGDSVKSNLELRGYAVTLCRTAAGARETLLRENFAAGVLDIELPDGDGIALCEAMRLRDAELPILIITARSDENTALASLGAGADDHIRKPFGLRELALRLEKLIQKRSRLTPVLRLGVLRLDLDEKKAHVQNQDLGLSRKEFWLLRIFVENAGRLLTRVQLVNAMEGEEILQDRTIDSHISHLRKKMQQAHCDEVSITSVYGEGYRLVQKRSCPQV